MAFTHLHVHTEYSLLDGMCRVGEVVQKAKDLGMTALAITDHGALYGAFKFYIKAKDAGIKPIIGVEVYKAKNSRFDKDEEDDRERSHLVLLAKNLEGYVNLMKLVSIAHLEGMYSKPKVDFEILEKYASGIIALSGCLEGEISRLILDDQMKEAETVLQKYVSIFKDDFYIELQRHPNVPELDRVNTELIKLSRKHGVPVVATNDVHYLSEADAYAQEVLLCIQTQRTIFEKNRPMSMIDVPDYYFKTESEMRTAFADIPEAVDNTQVIADKCNLEIPYGKWVLPKYDTPDNLSPESYLRQLTNERKGRIIGYDTETVEKRLEYELNIISTKGYATYFLIVQDFVNWGKRNGVGVGPGRGSVAGSLVAYALGITDINPLEHNLPFERFLNPERPTPPDIDIDFADVQRDEVLAYVTHKYGKEKVAQIITFGTMEARLVVRDVGRALGMSYAQGDRIAKLIPQGKQGAQMKLSQALVESAQLKYAYDNESETKRLIDIAQRLESLPRHSSVHAAGVIIAANDLTNYVPIQTEAKQGRVITQYDMYCLDLNAVSNNKAVGLLKVDFLGLRNLSILDMAIRLAEKKTGTKIDIHEIRIDDKKTYDLISEGHTIGVFQLESAGMRRLAKDLKPSRMSDITAMVALYRPGPMDLIPAFIAGKNNAKTIKYLHPDLKNILGETYGVLVYQEQVMEIAHSMAGYSMSEADNLRMAMGKKKKALMDMEHVKFVEGCQKHGYTKTLAERIFEFMEKFAAYGFNKPHSASYGLIAYWTAYMKANFPVEYMTALLTAELQGVAGPMREIKMAQAIEECRRMKIDVLPPDINTSESEFTIDGTNIRFGLSAIKNVGSAAIDSILEARKSEKFTCFSDFLTKVDLRKVNKKTVESLIKAGSFLAFGNFATLLSAYPEVVHDIAHEKESQEKGQFGLFAGHIEKKKAVDTFKTLPEYSEDQLAMFEKDVIGFLITKNPLSRFAEIIKEKASKQIGEILKTDAKKTMILAGVISSKKIIKTKKDNKDMAFITLYDDTGTIEAVLFPKTFEKLKQLLEVNQAIIAKGTIANRDDSMSFLIDNAVKLG
jgi:DNA polymerase-3 subunit alpha